MKAFRCAHSGKYFPADYIKEWGRKYGIGLGPIPVSECWDTEYAFPPDTDPQRVRRAEQIGYGVRVCMAQVDLVDVPEEEYEANRLILDSEDPTGERRAEIIRENQLRKPGSILPILLADFKKGGK